MKTHHRLLAPIALLALGVVPLHAVVISDDFTNATPGTANVTGANTFTGDHAGSGWLAGWRAASSNTTVTAAVLNDPPVKSGGNYFSGTIATGANTALDRGGIGRPYDFTGSSLATTPFQVSFDFRVDSKSATLNYDIFDTNTRSPNLTSNISWQLEVVGTSWYVRNGATDTLISGMAFAAGTTYSISVGVDIASAKWSYSISDGSTTVSGSALSFRGAGYTNTDGTTGGRWFEVIASEGSDSNGASTTFSLDNVMISTIPEPSTYALLFGVATLGAVCIWKRRR